MNFYVKAFETYHLTDTEKHNEKYNTTLRGCSTSCTFFLLFNWSKHWRQM